MKDIKPCPFCGGSAEVRLKPHLKAFKNDYSYYVFVQCCVCGGSSKTFYLTMDSEKDNCMEYAAPHYAIEAWNRRTEIEVNQENNERIQIAGFSRRIS